MIPANGLASASHIKTPPTVTAAVIHKTRSILVIWDSIICPSDGSFNKLLLYTLRNRRATCEGRNSAKSNKEANIKNPTLALTAVAVLLGGLLLLKSDATALPGMVGAPALTKKYSSIQKAGCFLAGRYCRVGFHWVCGLPPNPERRRCHCVPC